VSCHSKRSIFETQTNESSKSIFYTNNTNTNIRPKTCLPNIARTPNKKLIQQYCDFDDDIKIDETENPWLPEKISKPSEIKIGCINSLGLLIEPPNRKGMCTQAPPRYSSIVSKDNTKAKIDEIDEPDPILKATIILNCTKPEDEPYDHVSKRIKAITAVASIKTDYMAVLKPCPNIKGKVNLKKFDKLLSIYENNQVYYQECIDNNSLSEKEISKGLTDLELWFVNIIEPMPKTSHNDDIDDWKKRQAFKEEKGYTSYCDPDLYKYINI
jgi:hypothetical protein